MKIQLRYQPIYIVVLFLLVIESVTGYYAVTCFTATWNNTFRVIAGITGVASSSATALNGAMDVGYDSNRSLYVADYNNNRIQRFPSGSATAVTVPGLSISLAGAVYVTVNDAIYVSDVNNYRILRVSNGNVTVVAGGRGSGSGLHQIGTCYAIYIDSNDNIYVSDYANHRVAMWTATNPNISQVVAGGYGAGSTAERLYYPRGLDMDNNGGLYIADASNHRIQLWYPGAAIGITVAGQTGVAGQWAYLLNNPMYVLYDHYGYIYIMDSGNNRIQRWIPGATYGTTVVASPTMSNPRRLNFDPFGNLIVADFSQHRILSFAMLCPPNATTTTLGTTQSPIPVCSTAVWNQTFTILAGSTGNAGSTATLLSSPYSSYIDLYGNTYVADYNNHRIQYFPRGSLTGTTVAGITSSAGSSFSQLYNPSSIYVDPSRTMYILDTSNCRVLRWTPGEPLGFVVAGDGSCGSTLNRITTSYGMFVTPNNDIYISDFGNHRVVLWTSANTTFGNLVAGGYGWGSTAERLYYPWGIFVDSNQALFIADRSNHRIQRWDFGFLSGVTVAGVTSTSGSWSYLLNNPTGITVDPFGILYILDTGNNRIMRWVQGASYGTRIIGSLSNPYGLIFSSTGSLVVADTSNHRVVSYSMSCPNATTTTASPPTTPQSSFCPTAIWNQTLTILAGITGSRAATPTLLNYPYDLTFDGYQNLFVADTTNHRIQYFPRGSTTGTTVAGSSTGSLGSSLSELYNPYYVHVDSNRMMYILDTSNYRVLRWQIGDPLGFVVAGGNGNGGGSNQIGGSYAMFVDSNGNIYVSESTNHRVTFWSTTNTSFGALVAGGNGWGSTSERLYNPWGVYVDSNQAVFVVDRSNHRVQRWDPGALQGVTVAGTTGSSGPWSYQMSSPTAILFDPNGFMYILDYGNNRVLKWYPGAPYGITVVSASFYNPCGMRFDRLNNIVIADTYNHRITTFGVICPAATTTTALPPTSALTQICPTAIWNQTGVILAGITSSRAATPILLNYPYDVAFDGYQNIYVADTYNHRIQYFPRGSTTGTTVAGISSGSWGSGFSELYYPADIHVDANRAMFILDSSNCRVLRWQLGEPLGYVVAGGTGCGSQLSQISTSYSMFIDNQANIYVSDNSNNRVTLWLFTNRTSGILVAGGNGAGSAPERLSGPWGIYVDVNGTMFISDRGNHRVQLWRPGAISGTTVAGNTGDAGPYSYQLNSPTAITVDPYGFIYILDSSNNRVQKWFPGASYGSTIISASMSTPYGMTVDNLGNIVIADTFFSRISSYSLTCPASTTTTALPSSQAIVPICQTAVWNQTFSTLAGSLSNPGATATLFNRPIDVGFDGYRNMYIADLNNHRVQRFSPGSNVGTTIAGVTSSWGSARALLYYPHALEVTDSGTMYILDTYNFRVLRWQAGEPLGFIVAGGNGNGNSGGGFNQIGYSYALFIDQQQNIYISDNNNHRIVRWSPLNTTSGVLVAGGNGAGSSNDKLNSPWGIHVTSTSIFIADCGNHRIQRWDFGSALGTTVAGTSANSGPWSYQLNQPTAIAFDPFGYLYIMDYGNDRVQKWYPGDSYGVTIVAASSMVNPYRMKFDRLGNIIICDTDNHRVIQFSVTCPASTTTTTPPPTQAPVTLCPTAIFNQTFSTLVGSMGSAGSTATLLNNPYDVDFDGYRNLYVVDRNNHRIQRFPSGSNVGSTIAGFSLGSGSSLSELSSPSAIKISPSGQMYILDTSNYRVLRWQVGEPRGYVVVGGRGSGSSFDRMGDTYAMFVDTNWNIYISEYTNHRVTLWYQGNTTAGTLVAGGNGAGNTQDKLNSPWGVYVDGNGTIYVVDRLNHRVQMWRPGASLGSTVAGSPNDAGPYAYQFNNPLGITFDPYGFMYVTDYNNNRVQKWFPGASYGTTIAAGSISGPIGIRVDPLGNLVIADALNHRIISYGLVCPSATTTTTVPPIPTTIPLCQTATWNQTFSIVAGTTSSLGSTATLLYYPHDVSFDGYRNMYVVDHQNHRIQRFSPGSMTGQTVAGINGVAGGARSLLYYPTAISVMANGSMYILDTSNYRVLKWQVGEPLGYVVAGGAGNGAAFTQIGASYQLFIDNQFNVYVSENSNHRITRWSTTNSSWGHLIAGGNGAGNTAEKLNSPWGIYLDSMNGLYIVDRSNHRVQYWPAGSSLGITVAGSTSDPGPWSYQFSSPTSIIFDRFGFMYVLDYNNERIQKWYPGATFGTTVAAANLYNAYGMAMDPMGNFAVADTYYHRVIQFGLLCLPTTTTTSPPPTQPIIPLCQTATYNQSVTILGGSTGSPGSTATLLSAPYDVDTDAVRNLYVVDFNNHRIQRFPLGSLTATTVAGSSGSAGSSRSQLSNPTAISVTANGTMFILDRDNYRVLRWQVGDTLGYVVAGGAGNGGAFTQIGTSYGLFVDQNMNVYVSEQSNHRVTLWYQGNSTTGSIVAGGNGNGNTPEKLSSPWGIFVDVNGSIYVVDRGNHRIQKWDTGASFGVLVAGSPNDPGVWSYQLTNPTAITMDQYGFLYILDYSNSRIQKWYPGASYGATVISGTMNLPVGFRFDRLGNFIVADTSNHRAITYSLICPPTTTTTTLPPLQTAIPLCPTAIWNSTFTMVVGSTGTAGSTSTLLSSPYDITFDGYGFMYVADFNNHRIQRYRQGSNIGTTVAGFNLGSGSGRSELYNPSSIYVDQNQNMYILDTYNYRVLNWKVGEPIGTVIVNGRGAGSTFDRIGRSHAIYVDAQFNIYVSEYGNHRVTKWMNGNNTAGVLVAGGNGAGSTPEKLYWPWGIVVDSTNTAIYIVDRGNHRVQKWNFGAATADTVAGTTGDPGPWAYQLNNPSSINLDQYGFLYIVDTTNARIQKWYPGASYGTTIISTTMNSPIGFSLDLSGNYFIADTSNHRILSFGLICPSTTTTTAPPPTISQISICPTAIWNQTFTILAGITSSIGSTATLLYNPYDLAFDGYRNLYVADTSNHRIQLFRPGSTSGTTVAGNSGSFGYGRSELYNPYGISVTANGTMFILDTSNHRVLRWQLGEPLGTVVVNGRGSGSTFDRISTSYAFFVDNQLNIYVSESANERVTRWANGNNTAGTLVAGGNGNGNTAEKLNGPWGIFVDSNQAIFIVDRGNHRVQRWDPGANSGITVAGSPSDPGVWSYQFSSPTSIIFDPYGFMYVLDTGNNRVQKWFPGATYGQTIVAGTMSNPSGLHIDLSSNLVIADRSYHRIISFGLTCPPTTTTTIPPPTVSTIPLCPTAVWNSTTTIVAGITSTIGSTSTLLYYPYDVAFDEYRNLYVADTYNHRIQRFRPGSSIGTTVAGNSGSLGYGRSELYYPSAISVTSNSVMYILDTYNCRVLRWQIGEPLGTIVINGRGCGSGLDRIGRAYGLFIDNQLNIYISDSPYHRVTRWANGNNTAGSLVAGGNGAGVTAEKLNNPWGIFVDNQANLYVADRNNHRVQLWNVGAANGITVAGDTNGVAGPFSYQLNNPTAIMFDPYGFLYVLDDGNSRIQKWLPGATFGTTILAATFSDPLGMRIDQLGNLFVADTNFHRVQSFSVYCAPTTTTTVSPPPQTVIPLCSTAVWNSTATLVAGVTASAGNTATFLSSPYDVNFDKYQNIYVADFNNHRIQQYQYGSNVGRTVAGVTSNAGSTFAQLYNPSAIYINSRDTMFILDTTNYRVLRWQLGDQLGSVVVNGRGSGSTLDRIGLSYAMCFDNQDNVYISENGNHRVTKWTLSNNTAGQLVAGGSGAGNSAEKLNSPWGVYIDSVNSLFVVDRGNHRIQKWTIGSPFGVTVAGESGVSGPWSYQFNSPTAISFDSFGQMYILDNGNSRIQKWTLGMTYGITIISGSLSNPLGMYWDFSNNFFVADTSNHRIVRFNLLCPPTTTTTLAFPTLPANLACQTGVFNTSWSVVAGQTATLGSSSTLLNAPTDVFIDGNFFIYVADTTNHRIQKFRSGSTSGNTVAGVTSSSGSSYSQLSSPTAIFVDLSGAMYIADMTNYRIQKWLPDQPLGFTVAGGRGNGATLDRIGVVYGIFVDLQGNIYVSENSNHRVTIWFASNTTAGELVAGGSSLGNTSAHLNSPWGVHVDLNRTLYVVDRGNHRVQKWFRGFSYGITVAGTTGVSGSTSSLLNSPTAITIDTNDFIYIMDAGNNRVQRFAPGSFVADTIAAMSFSSPRGMRLDSIGNLYIADQNNHRIIFYRCVYNASTTTITTLTTTTTTSTTSTTRTSTTSTTTTSTTPPTTTTQTTTTTSTATTETTTTPSTSSSTTILTTTLLTSTISSTISVVTTTPATTIVTTTAVVTTAGTAIPTTAGTTAATTAGTTAPTTAGTTVATTAGTTVATTPGTTVATTAGTTVATTPGTTVITTAGTGGTTVATTAGTAATTAATTVGTAGTTVATSGGTAGTTVATTAGTTVATTAGTAGTTVATTAGTTVATTAGTAGTTIATTAGTTVATTAGTTVLTTAGTTVATTPGTTVATSAGATAATTAGTTAATTAGTSGASTTISTASTITSPGGTATTITVATTLTTVVVSASTTTGIVTTAGSVATTAGGGATTAGSGTAAPSGSDTTTQASQASTSIGAIVGGAIGGAAGFAALVYAGVRLCRKLDRDTSSSTSKVNTMKEGNVSHVKETSTSSETQGPMTSNPKGPSNPPSNPKVVKNPSSNMKSMDNGPSKSFVSPDNNLPKLDPEGSEPTKMNVNSRSYNIHVIQS